MRTFISSNKISWAYVSEGAGPDMLLIHGWGVDHRIWRQQIKYFSAFRRVIAVDLPGHGQTSWNDMTLEQLAVDLSELLRAEAVVLVDVVGSSLGGMVALKLLDVAPSLVRSLVMVGSLPKFSKSKEYPYGANVARMLKIYHQVHWKFPTVLHSFFRSMFTLKERSSRRFKWMERFRADEPPPNQWAIKEYLTILFNEDLRRVFTSAAMPVCLMYGTGDPICGTDSMMYMKTLLPQADFVAFEDFGHFPFLMSPDEFNEALAKFLSRVMSLVRG